MREFISDYIKDLTIALSSIDYEKLLQIVDKILEVKHTNRTVFLIGNGGSSATPSHSAGDWMKEIKVKTLCLTDNTPSVTAFANDTDYSNIFKGQLETLLSDGDLIIAYSGSGNSPNIINAIEYAKSRGNLTIGFSGNYNGRKGGKLVEVCDIPLIANTTSMERIEDIHLVINHMIKEYIKERISTK